MGRGFSVVMSDAGAAAAGVDAEVGLAVGFAPLVVPAPDVVVDPVFFFLQKRL